MISRAKFNMGVVLFLALCFVGLFHYQRSMSDTQGIHIEVLELKDGYGYKILKGQRILIFQEFIPGFAGKQSFETKKQALTVANLVLYKLKNGKSPILGPSDLLKSNIAVKGAH